MHGIEWLSVYSWQRGPGTEITMMCLAETVYGHSRSPECPPVRSDGHSALRACPGAASLS
ncbi:hypothetical protein [Kitasatospora aureofaciens]|uniref:hypothetical protein n=1 Tax=Kitasatospora aureofaciens TaxID=1894 RepID=UPI003813A135